MAAESIQAEGRAYFPNDISRVEACENAFLAAKKNAMSQAGLERGRFSVMDICSEDEQGSTCSLIQESQSYFEGGYVANSKIEREDIVTGAFKECVVNATFDVRKFETEPDVNFVLEAELNKRKFFDKEEVSISGNVSQAAFIYLLGYNPSNDKLELLIPNKFEEEAQVQNNFLLPSAKGKTKYKFFAYLPDGYKKESLAEFMVLLATKKKFVLLEETSASQFYTRLEEFGRSNWRKIDLGYTIFRN